MNVLWFLRTHRCSSSQLSLSSSGHHHNAIKNKQDHWPKKNTHIKNATAAHASSYSKECLILTLHLRWPFQKICEDYFELNISPMLTDLVVGYVYAISQMVQLQSNDLITQCRTLFMNYGAPYEFSWDIGPRFTSTAFREFLQTWGVAHHLSSVSYPQFNDRAEAAVKTVKHIIQENVASNGSLRANKLVKTTMQYPNNLYLVYHLVPLRYFSTEYLPS